MRVVNTMNTVTNTGTGDTVYPTRLIIPDKDDTTWDYSPPIPRRYGPHIIPKENNLQLLCKIPCGDSEGVVKVI